MSLGMEELEMIASGTLVIMNNGPNRLTAEHLLDLYERVKRNEETIGKLIEQLNNAGIDVIL
jgi:hypothetical protein